MPYVPKPKPCYLDEMIKLPAVYRHYKKYQWVNNITREDTEQ